MTLQAIAELSYRQLYPNPTDETPITLAEFIQTAKAEYANFIWQANRNLWREEGQNIIPEYLLADAKLEVKNNAVDISSLKVLRSMNFLSWIQSIRGSDDSCNGCNYVVVDNNKYRLLCNDESFTENTKFAVPMGSFITFPKGTYGKDVYITYASLSGDRIDGTLEIDEAIGDLVRRSLIEIYGGKTNEEDKTNNSNGNS